MTDEINDDDSSFMEVVDTVGHQQIHTLRLPSELEGKVLKMTNMQRRYAELRSRGLSKVDASKGAGSKAKDRQSLSRCGFIMEKDVSGMTEYIAFLYNRRNDAALLDDVEIVQNLRIIIQTALSQGKLKEATAATQLLGTMIGSFKTAPKHLDKSLKSDLSKEQVAVDAFTNEGSDFEERREDINAKVKMTNQLMKLVRQGSDKGLLPVEDNRGNKH